MDRKICMRFLRTQFILFVLSGVLCSCAPSNVAPIESDVDHPTESISGSISETTSADDETESASESEAPKTEIHLCDEDTKKNIPAGIVNVLLGNAPVVCEGQEYDKITDIEKMPTCVSASELARTGDEAKTYGRLEIVDVNEDGIYEVFLTTFYGWYLLYEKNNTVKMFHINRLTCVYLDGSIWTSSGAASGCFERLGFVDDGDEMVSVCVYAFDTYAIPPNPVYARKEGEEYVEVTKEELYQEFPLIETEDVCPWYTFCTENLQ